MTVHLLKLCVGIDSLEELQRYQIAVRARKAAQGIEPVSIHWTRNRPRRDDEVLDGGSLYWVIRREVRARQRIVRLDEGVIDGQVKCGLVLDDELVRVERRPFRPFQGWRYLEAKNAPADLPELEGDEAELPEDMARELRAIGVL